MKLNPNILPSEQCIINEWNMIEPQDKTTNQTMNHEFHNNILNIKLWNQSNTPNQAHPTTLELIDRRCGAC